ncbi:hypothetical protein HMPREF1210_00517 [Paenisporosarcina sp. HGH0030]|nr:hypothetical protein HMPREF1210_00517 [Paenisporosarcina sp. HGH0030]
MITLKLTGALVNIEQRHLMTLLLLFKSTSDNILSVTFHLVERKFG